ncbi:MAG: hypothetical protein LBN93_11195, partial [Candidatus Symbiothrix sp.]|nr:hypothetical protein [Candidatus Symbiothrix sp.]
MRKIQLILFTACLTALATCLHAADTTPFSVFYSLNQTTTVTPAITGHVLASNETLSDDAEIQGYITAINGPDELIPLVSGTDRLQRVQRPGGVAFPAETDVNLDRYVQFTVAPNEGWAMSIDSIGLYVGSAGSASMGCSVRVSLSSDFSDYETVGTYNSGEMANNYIYPVSSTENIVVGEGQTLYVRAYFWNSAANAKMLLIKNVTIRGTLTETIEGDPFTIFYPLNQTTTVAPTITGNVAASNETFAGTVNVVNYNTSTIGNAADYPDIDASTDHLQSLRHNDGSALTTAIVWPQGNFDPDVYVQFAVSAEPGTSLRIDSIGLLIGGFSGSGVFACAGVSTDISDVSDHIFATRASGNANGSLYPLSTQQSIIVAENGTAYIRVYYYQGAADLKAYTAALKNVMIAGKVIAVPQPPALTSFSVGGVNGTIDPSEETITLDIPTSNPIFDDLSDVATYFTTLDDETTVTIGGAPVTTGDGVDYSETGNGLEHISVVLTNGVGEITYDLTIHTYIAFSVMYSLNETTTPTTTGNVTAPDEVFSDWAARDYSTSQDNPAYPSLVSSTDKMQRLWRTAPDTTTPGINWPDNETGINPDRYVQFAVTPKRGTELTVDSIGLYLGGSGSGSIQMAARASTSFDFDAPEADTDTLLYSASGNANNYLYPASSTKIRILAEGDTLYVRAYFWINGTNQNRAAIVKNVMISGRLTEVPLPPALTSFTVGGVNGIIDPSEETITLDIPTSNPIFGDLSDVATYFTTLDDETTVTIGGSPVTTGDGIDYSETGNGLEHIAVVLTNSLGEVTYDLTIHTHIAFSVVYPLNQTTTVTPIIEGNVTASDETFSGTVSVANYSTSSIGNASDFPDIDASTDHLQRLLHNDGTDLSTAIVWPLGSFDPDCYVEFSVSAKPGTTLRVDSIGLLIGGLTGSGLFACAGVSTDISDVSSNIFATRASGNVNGNLYPMSSTQGIEVAENGTVYIRVYYYQGAADEKAYGALLKNVMIAGRLTKLPPALTSFTVGGVDGIIDPIEGTITLDLGISNSIFSDLSDVATYFTTLDDETTVTIGGVSVTSGDGVDYSETGNGLEHIAVVVTNSVDAIAYDLTILTHNDVPPALTSFTVGGVNGTIDPIEGTITFDLGISNSIFSDLSNVATYFTTLDNETTVTIGGLSVTSGDGVDYSETGNGLEHVAVVVTNSVDVVAYDLTILTHNDVPPALTSFTVGGVDGIIDPIEGTITLDLGISNSIFSDLSDVATYFTTLDEETTVTIGGSSVTTGDGVDYSETGNGLEHVAVVVTNSVDAIAYDLTILTHNDVPPALTSFTVGGVDGTIDPSEGTITLDLGISNLIFSDLSNVATYFTTLDEETTVTIGGVSVTSGDGVDYSETGNGLEHIAVVVTNSVDAVAYELTILTHNDVPPALTSFTVGGVDGIIDPIEGTITLDLGISNSIFSDLSDVATYFTTLDEETTVTIGGVS